MCFVVAPISLVAALVPTQDALSMCNKSAHAVKIAVSHFNGVHWSSQDWWPVAEKKCAELVTGGLDARYYCLYATDGASACGTAAPAFALQLPPNSRLSDGAVALRAATITAGYSM
jgi:uncharacterized membrane protein